MMKLVISGNEYKVRFGYNSFCDTDVMERVEDLIKIFNANDVKDDESASELGVFKELFCLVRELLFIGFERYNPVESLQEVGNLLDDYREEAPEGESRDLFVLFEALSEELTTEGFFGDLMMKVSEAVQTKTPTTASKKSSGKK